MAKKKSKMLLWLIGLGGAGYLAYNYFSKQKVPATTLPGSAPSDIMPISGPAQVLPINAVSTTMNQTTGMSVAPSGPVDLSGGSLPGGITQDMYNKVMTWSHDVGKPPVLDFAAAMIPGEYQGMYDLIVNGWPGLPGTPLSVSQVQFWNSLRNKYDPTHKYW